MALFEPPSERKPLVEAISSGLTALSVDPSDAWQLVDAVSHAEEEFLLGVTAQALSAESGTEAYGFENVVGVGLGERTVAGRPTGEAAVTMFVIVKAGHDRVDPAALIPDRIEGVPTDIVETGEFVAFTERGRHRPAMPGVSIGHHDSSGGTFGFLARRDAGLYVVSNNHVLARGNDASAGDVIVQPSKVDGGLVDADALARLTSWVPLNYEGGRTPVDCAMAEVSPDAVTPRHMHFGDLESEPVPAGLSTLVRKSGRTTGVTRGVVTQVGVTTRMRVGTRRVLLANQFTVRGLGGAFSSGGDSGSLVVDEATRCPVGLLCGGGTNYSLVSPIAGVLDGLGVSFAV